MTKQHRMIHELIAERAAATPEKLAIVQGRTRVSYAELHRKISTLACYLVDCGVQKGDRVAILSENSPEYIIAYFGAQQAGAIAVDINFQYSAAEVRKLLDHCTPTVLIVQSKYAVVADACLAQALSVRSVITMGIASRKPTQAENSGGAYVSVLRISFDDILEYGASPSALPEVSSSDIAAIIYTSGTTGDPKGVMLTHDNFLSNGWSIIEYLELTERDSVMVILPFCYSYGKSLLTTHLMAGGTLVLENSFLYPDVVLKKMITEEVTGFSGVPSTFAILLNRSAMRNYSFPALRYVTQAGGPMPPQHAQELMQVLPKTDIYIMYGQTEAAPRLTYLEPREVVRKAGSIGRAIPGVTIELITPDGALAKSGEEGEIVASGRNIMTGYWNNPEETGKVLREGKLFTGDIARWDDEGYLYIVGRRNDMIKSGAHRISPKEIEEAILDRPEVHEVAVIGMDDAILGQAIKAVIVLKEGKLLDPKEVQRHCQTRLAPFKIPKEVQFVPELPKTNSGKVRRHLLKQHSTNIPAAASGKDAVTNL